MKKVLAFLFAIMLPLVGMNAQNLPEPKGFVNDFANIIPADKEGDLEATVLAFEKSTGIELAIVTIEKLPAGTDIDSYAIEIGEKWNVGKYDRNNGIVMLMAVKDRRLSIRTGEGVMNVVTDNKIDKIIRDDVRPHTINDDFSGGVIAGALAIMDVVQSFKGEESGYESTAPRVTVETPVPYIVWERMQPEEPSWLSKHGQNVMAAVIVVGVFGIFFLVTYPSRRRKRARENSLEWISDIQEKLLGLKKLSRDSAVSRENVRELKRVEGLYKPFEGFTTNSPKADWRAIESQLDDILTEVEKLEDSMSAEIALAREAPVKGPELLSALPARLAEIEGKLKDGDQSNEAYRMLEKAKEAFAEAERHTNNSTINWVMIYNLLRLSNSQADSARRIHEDYQPSYSPPMSTNFNSISRPFGGGGGFSIGGGSSGSIGGFGGGGFRGGGGSSGGI